MGRLIVVVALLAALAFLANKYLLQGGDPRPEDAKPKAGADAAMERDSKAMTKSEAVATDAEAAVAEAAPAATVSTDVDAAATSKIAETAAEVTGEKLADAMPEETVKLDDPSLTAGIPGDGPLSLDEIKKWLADPKNHAVLKPELPLGLAAGAAEIKGLDENPLTRAKIELGRQLYFDQRLSADGSISCASCHAADAGFASHDRFGIGVRKQMGGRNSPVAYNRILSAVQFWDGRAPTLEEQAKGPIANPIEMSNTHEACVAGLKKVPGYVVQFEAIFDDGVNIDNAARAIASFERALVTGPAPWDVYQDSKAFEDAWSADLEDLDALKTDDPELYADYMAKKAAAEKSPISDSAVRGGELFFSQKAGCTACHLGANFTDELYHNLGVGMEAQEPDLGRFVITNVEKDKGAFKTPTVRNVALTAPYMHDGSQKTLEEVVEWYAKGGHPNPWLDEKVKKLELSDQDKQDLVAFMAEGLTGELPQVERTRLPADPEIAAENAAETRAEEAKAAGG
jgi:cytochrome c peroxidase